MNDPTTTPRTIFDRRAIAIHRHRAATGATEADFLLAHVAADFKARLSLIKRRFDNVLDLGANNGRLGRELAGIVGAELMIAMDDAPRLLARCRPPRVLANEEAMPFAPDTFELIVSALKLQFSNDLPGVLIQARRALKPDGLFLAALLGPETLHELREAFVLAETECEDGASPRVAPFIDVRQAGALLQRAGFALPVADTELVTVTYETPVHLMHDLRAMGAANPLVDRLKKPTRRLTLLRAAEIYQEKFSTGDGRIPATFEIVTLTGWSPHESQQKPLRPGSAEVSLATVLTPRHPNPETDDNAADAPAEKPDKHKKE